jgi:dipeptide transport system substrate-binding protein
MKRMAYLAAAAALTLGMAGTAHAATQLVYCSEGSPENFNPQLNTTGTSLDAARPIYNQLVQFKHGTTEVEPGLAESWDIAADGLSITFHLRKGVKFGSNANFKPTRDFNADDVIFSFARQSDENNPYHKVSGGSYDYFADMTPGFLAGVEKVDDYTVKFNLKHPEAPALADLAMDFASILSAEYADAMLKAGTPEKVDQDPIGTGPFTFVAYQKDAAIRFKANPDYWGGKPKIDNLVYAITPDATQRWAKLQKNECQVMFGPNPSDIPAIQKDADVNLLTQPGLNIAYLAFNVTKPPFDKKEVRQALSMAFDKDAIIKEVYQGTGVAAKNFIPPTIWGYNDSITDYKYDPKAAKKMLDDAGVKDLKTDLWYIPITRSYNPNSKRIAEIMQQDLKDIGIEATLVTYEWGDYRKRLQAGEHQMGQLGWGGDNGDPDNFFFLLGCDAAREGGNNITKWCNQDFEKLFQEAKVTTDQAARAKLYEQMQVIAHEEAPVYTIAHTVVYEPIRKNVVGYLVSPLGRHEFDQVDVQ